jgi:multidrug resistance efflux pump
MIELILGTYGLGCWLIFSKFKLVRVTTYTVCTAILGGIIILFSLMIMLTICHPVSHDGRFYAVVTQVVPQVRGTVTSVPVIPNTPLREGDILFTIDPRPYQIEVERLEAKLASMNSKVAQLDAKHASAQAATQVARSKLLVSESDYDRQARIALDNANAQIARVQSQLTLATANYERSTRLQPSGAVSREQLETDKSKTEQLTAELAQANSAAKAAEETLASGGNRLNAARDELKQAEASEREARIALESENDGENPEVRQTMAELDRKRWELEHTTVRAPSDGIVPQVSLRAGQMATPFSLNAAMLFIPKEKQYLVATFPQNAIAGFEPGMEAELAFKAYPGQIFPAKVYRVQAVTAEGDAITSGQLFNTTSAKAPESIPVSFEYGPDVEALNLPAGAQVSVAVYTHKLHAIALVRKIILRIKSWENYAGFLHHFDAVH